MTLHFFVKCREKWPRLSFFRLPKLEVYRIACPLQPPDERVKQYLLVHTITHCNCNFRSAATNIIVLQFSPLLYPGKQWVQDLKPFRTSWEKEYLTTAPYIVLLFKQVYGMVSFNKFLIITYYSFVILINFLHLTVKKLRSKQ